VRRRVGQGTVELRGCPGDHVLRDPDLVADLLELAQGEPRRASATPLTTEPVPEGRALYSVTRGLQVELYTDFGRFASRVNGLLNGGWRMRALTARGTYDVPTVTLEANYVAVAFTAPFCVMRSFITSSTGSRLRT